MTNLLYKNEAYEIIGVCMEVHRTLGFGFLEVIYKDAMELEFIERQISFVREKMNFLLLQRKNPQTQIFCRFYYSYDNIIVEVKANKEGIACRCMWLKH